jgi:hypothetical protein
MVGTTVNKKIISICKTDLLLPLSQKNQKILLDFTHNHPEIVHCSKYGRPKK